MYGDASILIEQIYCCIYILVTIVGVSQQFSGKESRKHVKTATKVVLKMVVICHFLQLFFDFVIIHYVLALLSY